mgnify:CR=1 FL=1
MAYLKIVPLLVVITALLSPNAARASQVEDISSAGPFRASSRRIERFSMRFNLAPADVKRHMAVVIHNGFGDSPGFTWLRVFLCGDVNVASMDRNEEPIGDLLLDEDPVQRQTIRLELTDLVKEGTNTLVIEGKGQKGAVLSLNLEGAVLPKIAALNPDRTRGGARLVLSGTGFSPDPDENKVTVNGVKARTLASTRTSLTVEVPNTLKEGEADLEVTTNGLKSAPYLIEIDPTPEVFALKRSDAVTDRLEISGRHLGTNPTEVEVLFGQFKARVLEATPDRLTVMIPPQVYSDESANIPVSVLVDDMRARGNLWYTR